MSERRRKCSDEHRPESLIMAVCLLLWFSDAHANSADSPLRERGTPANGIERLTLAAGVSASVTHRLGYRDVRDQFHSSHAWTRGVLQAPDRRWNEVTHHLKVRGLTAGGATALTWPTVTATPELGISDTTQGTGESDASKGERIARKLEVGVATGYLLSLLGAGALGIGGSLGSAILGSVVGSAAGAVVGVISVDPPDRNNNSQSLFLGLAGSSVGAMLSLAVAASRDYSYRWFDLLAIRLCPSIAATIASELWREPPESRRFSIGLVPDPWGRLSTAATLRF